MYHHPFSRQHWICKLLHWANIAFDNTEAAIWEAHCLQHFVSWSSPSVRKFGPSTSNRLSQATTCLSSTSDMSTTDSSLVTLASRTCHRTKSYLTKASTENRSSWRLNPIRSFSASCWKHNPWSWFTMDPPTSHRSYHHTQHHHPKFFSVAFAPAATSLSKVPSQNTESVKAWTHWCISTPWLAFLAKNLPKFLREFWPSIMRKNAGFSSADHDWNPFFHWLCFAPFLFSFLLVLFLFLFLFHCFVPPVLVSGSKSLTYFCACDACDKKWNPLIAVRFIIISPEHSCTWTALRAFSHFSNQQWIGRIMRQTFTVAPAASIPIPIRVAIFIHLCHFLPRRLSLRLCHTEEFHMVINPEPNLRPLSIRRGPYPIEETRPATAPHSASARVESSNPAGLPAASIVGTAATDLERESRRSFKAMEPGHPRNNESEARPKKKQRTHEPTAISTPVTTTTPTFPIILDLPEGPTSDDSDLEPGRCRSPSATSPAPPASINPSAPVAVPPRPSPSLERSVTASLPAEAPTNPAVPPDLLSTTTYVLGRTPKIMNWSLLRVTHGPDPHGKQSGFASSGTQKLAKHVGLYWNRTCLNSIPAPNRKRKLKTNHVSGTKRKQTCAATYFNFICFYSTCLFLFCLVLTYFLCCLSLAQFPIHLIRHGPWWWLPSDVGQP